MAKQKEYYYLFPDPELRKEAEKLSKDYGIQLVCSAIASAVMAIVIICVCCTGWVFQVRLLGFACPIFIGVTLSLTVLASLQPLAKLAKVEKAQKEALKKDPKYEKNLLLYQKYDSFTKARGKTVIIAALISFAVSLVIGALMPDKLWSAAGFLPMVGGVAFSNRFYAGFRQSAEQIQREIDEQEEMQSRDDDDFVF